MNESEKRRKELLENTRNLYSDRRSPPAIHPRYSNAYHSIYPDLDENEIERSTILFRIVISLLLFLCFVTMDYNSLSFKKVDCAHISQEIKYQSDFLDIDALNLL